MDSDCDYGINFEIRCYCVPDIVYLEDTGIGSDPNSIAIAKSDAIDGRFMRIPETAYDGLLIPGCTGRE